MLCFLIQNKLLSIDAELEKDKFKGLEMRQLNEIYLTGSLPSAFVRGLSCVQVEASFFA